MARGCVETDTGREPLPDRIKAVYYGRLNLHPLSPEYRERVREIVEFFDQLKKTNGCETTASLITVACEAVGSGHDEDPRTESEGQVEDTQQADPLPNNEFETTITDSILLTRGGTVVAECSPTSAKVEATKEPDPPDIGVKTILINTGESVLYTDVYFCAEVNKFTLYYLAKSFMVIILLMNVGCTAMPLAPALCIAGTSAVGEATNVTCLFGRHIADSRLGVNVQMLPLHSTKDIAVTGKDVLVCSWQTNGPKCIVRDGYSFNYNISDRLTLEIPAATPEIAGVYKCHVALEVSSPRACNLTVTERRDNTSSPTTTHGTTGKATSTTAEPSKTMGLGYQVIVISLGLCAVVAASAFIHLLFYNRLKSRFNLAEKNTFRQNMLGTADEAKEILPKNQQTCRIELLIEEENRSLEQTT